MLSERDSGNRILEGTAAVMHIADHFVTLKQRVIELQQSFRASERGFFTPSEDDQTRHIQIAFWKSRNALFELVSSIYRIGELPIRHQPAAVLVAYSGALVLVDAARFLREQFHHRAVVRMKLNEPEPHFGIPADIYDTIQNSLTSPVHAWHLYHAGRYLIDHQQELDELVKIWPVLAELETVVDRLQNRLEVSPADYALARARVRGGSVRRQSMDLLTRAVYGLQKAVSRLVSSYYVRPGHLPRLPPEIHQQLAAALQPGDVLVTRKEYALTNYFLPGYWPHAAFYLGSVEELQLLQVDKHENAVPRWPRLLDCDPDCPQRVLEALKDGIRIRSVSCPLSSDAVAVIRPQLSPTDVAVAICRGLFHEGKPYDFDFDFSRSDRLVCTEVIYRSYEGIGGITFPLTRRAGRLTLSAEDLLQKALRNENFAVHCVYCPSRAPHLTFATDASHIIRETTTPN